VTDRVQIGIIGGSGLYDMAELTDREERTLTTPFGDPSGPYVIATLRGKRVAFLARHGSGHRLMPTELNYRANIYGMKVLGAEYILSASAVGSLQERYVPQHLVIPDQFFDRTKGRASTFFGNGLVAHVGFAHPVCGRLAGVAYDACKAAGANAHKGGTYVCMEGPQFSTLAESRLYRSWGMDIIGMTNLQEAKLAREAEICYATIALVTDYDCWHPAHDSVTVDMIVANLVANARTAQQVIADAVGRLPYDRTCECATALANAIITRPEVIPDQVKRDLAPIISKYVR
jgi:5'-methylthioadenosine phosphorylase